jgi:ubiquinone/menaquinone biosynthesis C-methylase UbiE
METQTMHRDQSRLFSSSSTLAPVQYIAAYLLELCPKFTPASVIQDNACGAGVVTNEIMKVITKAANSTSGISIHATDLSPEMVEVCLARVREIG